LRNPRHGATYAERGRAFPAMAQSMRSGVVLTGQQETWALKGGPGRFWEDKPNTGYSGTPLWKLHAERDARMQAEASSSTIKIPDGFVKYEGNLYWNEKRQAYWKSSDGLFYTWDAQEQKHVELHEARNYMVTISVGGNCHENALQVRHVIVRDFKKAAQALRMSIEHLDQPCAMYALYEGHRGGASGNACSEFCAKHFHGKLLPKLAAFRGYWDDERLKTVMRDSFEELDASFADKHPGVTEGCSAAVALVLGRRLVVASLGDIACVACLRSGEIMRLARAHAVPDPDAEEGDDDDESEHLAQAGSLSSTAPLVRWTRAFGDHDLKGVPTNATGEGGLSAAPDVTVLQLERKHHGFAFICRALYASIGGSPAVTTVFRRSAGRPRMASGALIDAAVQWLGQVGPDCGLASVVAFFEEVEAPDGPQAKKRRTEPAQVRLRHILLKHRECKATIDKVRNKQVRRTRAEAERILRGVLEELEGDRGQKKFTQRCRELSECQSCLKAADLAGDLGWVKRGGEKLGETFEVAAFALQVNQLSDLVDSDQGIHILMRTA